MLRQVARGSGPELGLGEHHSFGGDNTVTPYHKAAARANESTTQGLWAPVDGAAWSACTGLEFISLTLENLK